MSNLFELNDQFRELSQRDDLDPTVMKDTLDAIDDTWSEKLTISPGGLNPWMLMLNGWRRRSGQSVMNCLIVKICGPT